MMVSFPGVHNLKDQLVTLSTKTNSHVIWEQAVWRGDLAGAVASG